MKTIGFKLSAPIDAPESLIDFTSEKPVPKGDDLLVEVRAVSINPVDVKVRQGSVKEPLDEPKVIGYDAAGIVRAIGENVRRHRIGDEVYYAGDVRRPGTNSEYHLVEESIAGAKPKSLNFEQSAALPLTTITAWEALFERLAVDKNGRDAGKSILIIGAAGGVGSMAVQLAKKVANLYVIAGASREETRAWVRDFGADAVVNHRGDMPKELKSLGKGHVDYILCLNDTDEHWSAMSEAIKPQGRIVTVVENNKPLDMDALKLKSASFGWEFMFTRSMFQTEDRIEQKLLLDEVARLIDSKVIRTTLNKVISPINATNLKIGHAEVERGNSMGKLVLSGWE